VTGVTDIGVTGSMYIGLLYEWIAVTSILHVFLSQVCYSTIL
jgi:hypothetical protein